MFGTPRRVVLSAATGISPSERHESESTTWGFSAGTLVRASPYACQVTAFSSLPVREVVGEPDATDRGWPFIRRARSESRTASRPRRVGVRLGTTSISQASPTSVVTPVAIGSPPYHSSSAQAARTSSLACSWSRQPSSVPSSRSPPELRTSLAAVRPVHRGLRLDERRGSVGASREERNGVRVGSPPRRRRTHGAAAVAPFTGALSGL